MSFPRLKFVLILCFGISMGGNLVRAQEDYVLGPGDKIKISVIGEEAVTTEGMISPQGTITFWILGDIKAGGKKVGELKSELTQVLGEKYFQNPIMKLEVLEYHSKEIVIQGAVGTPGSYYLDTNWTTILKLISKAGSVTPEAGTYAYIIRGYWSPGKDVKEVGAELTNDPNRVEVNLKKLLLDGDLQEDKPVYGGDFVFIASVNSEELSRNFIWVEGAVRSAGKIPYQPGLTALSAVIAVGGFTDFASPNRTIIHRKNPDGSTTKIKLKLKNISKGKKPDVPLQPGDRLTIPESFF